MPDQPDPAIVPDEAVQNPPPEKPVDVPAPEPDAKEPEEKVEAEPEVHEEPQERPRSGYARLKARHSAVIQELEELKRKQAQPEEGAKPPKVEDFNGDYLAFERAAVAYEARQAVRDELGKARQVDLQVKHQEAQAENLDEFFERWGEFESKMPDAKGAVDTLFATIGPLNPVARDLIADAENGEVILYYLAKNPGQARQLNQADPLSAAKMIGQLEARTTLPKGRTETKAPPPMKVVKGGAAPPKDFAQAAKNENIADYVKMRQAMMKKD